MSRGIEVNLLGPNIIVMRHRNIPWRRKTLLGSASPWRTCNAISSLCSLSSVQSSCSLLGYGSERERERECVCVCVCVCVCERWCPHLPSALQVLTRDRERRHKHSDAAQHEDRPHEITQPPQQDRPDRNTGSGIKASLMTWPLLSVSVRWRELAAVGVQT